MHELNSKLSLFSITGVFGTGVYCGVSRQINNFSHPSRC